MSGTSCRAAIAAALPILILGTSSPGSAAGATTFAPVDEVEVPGVPAFGVSITFFGSHVYLGDRVRNSVLAYERDLVSGDLTLIDEEFGASAPTGLRVSSDGKNLYVADHFGDQVLVYTRDVATGEISLLESHRLQYVGKVLEGASGTKIYAVSSYRVTVYDRDPTTGALTFLQEEDWEDSIFLAEAIMSPDGAYIYTFAADPLAVFAVDPGTGEVALVGGTSGASGRQLAISQDGAHLYACRGGTPCNLHVYSRNAATGLLTLVEVETVSTGGFDRGLAISPDGGHVYVSDSQDVISVLSRDAGTGALTAAGTTTVRVDEGDLAVTPESAHVYTFADGATRIFSRDAGTGALTFSHGLFSFHDAHTGAMSPDGAHVYLMAHRSDQKEDRVGVFARDPVTGALTHVENHFVGTSPTGLATAVGVVVSPDGASVYAFARTITVLSRDLVTGALTVVEEETEPGPVARGVPSPDGKHLYAKGSGAIQSYLRDPVTGALTYLDSTDADASSWLAFSADGAFLYEGTGGPVQVWARDAGTGALTPVESEPVPTSGEGRAIALSPDGGHVYVGHDGFDNTQHRGPGELFAFARNSITGELVPVDSETNGSNGVFGLGEISGLGVSADGRHVFVAGTDRGSAGSGFDDLSTLTTFRRDPDSGVLALVQTTYEGGTHTNIRSILPSPDGAHVYRIGVSGPLAAIVYAPGFGCAEMPLAGCRTSDKAKVSFDASLLPAKERASFSWSKGADTSAGEFDPGTDNHFALCAYDESDPTPVQVFAALAPAGEDCRTKLDNPLKPCWTVGAKATKLKDPFQTPDGLRTLTLKPGADDFASIVASAQGVHVRPPDMPLGLPLRVQVQAASGLCWEAVFDAATTNVSGRFRAKKP